MDSAIYIPSRHDWVYVDGSRDEFLVIAVHPKTRLATVARVHDTTYFEQSVPIDQLTFFRKPEILLRSLPTPQQPRSAA